MEKLRNRYWHSLILLKQLVKTDFKLRYQGSFLGYVWSLLRPLALFIILYIVFAKFLRFGEAVPHFPVYLLLGIVFWNYFTEVTNSSVDAIVGKGELLRKIHFPRYVLVLAGSMSALINLAINFVVIAAFMLLTGASPIWQAAYVLPLVLLELFVFSLAISFLLSALYVRYRDVKYIWEVITQGAFYATPILYPLTLIPEGAAKVLMLNPMAQIIQAARNVLITPQTTTLIELYGGWAIIVLPLALVATTLVTAAWYFRQRTRYFAEEA